MILLTINDFILVTAMKWLALFCFVCRKLKISTLLFNYIKKFKTLISQMVNTVSKTFISRVVNAALHVQKVHLPLT